MKRPASPSPSDLPVKELDGLLAKTHPNLFAQPTAGAAFLQRMLEARRIIAELGLPAGSAYLALVDREQSGVPIQWRAIGAGLTVGRASKNDWGIADQRRSLSSTHFRIHRQGTEYFLMDLKSTNGTTVNENRQHIGSYSLRHGDFIYAGRCTFLFIIS